MHVAAYAEEAVLDMRDRKTAESSRFSEQILFGTPLGVVYSADLCRACNEHFDRMGKRK